MSGFGNFSTEAMEQLRQAYADQLQRAEEAEEAGVQVGADRLSVETSPVRSDWLDKTGLWKYPDGRGERQDVEQRQQDLLAALRDEEGNLPDDGDDGELELSGMSDEELDAMINDVLAEIDDEEEEGGDPEGDDLDDDEFDAALRQVLDGIDDETTDEEIDAMLDELLGPADGEDEEEGDEPEDEEPDADDIAARIAELKAELAALTEGDDDEEEEDEDYAPEETQGDVEEETEDDTDTEPDEDTADDEEATPDDEPN